jgi:DNA invertase Pin-like site-specific DNA recombinase
MAAGCGDFFEEQVSSVEKRDELEKALRFVRKGDALVVTKLDRLARSIPDLVKIRRLSGSNERAARDPAPIRCRCLVCSTG